MDLNTKKTSAAWIKDIKYAGYKILDPDGWDRSPEKYDYSFNEELITRLEFEKRLFRSTLMGPISKIHQL